MPKIQKPPQKPYPIKSDRAFQAFIKKEKEKNGNRKTKVVK